VAARSRRAGALEFRAGPKDFRLAAEDAAEFALMGSDDRSGAAGGFGPECIRLLGEARQCVGIEDDGTLSAERGRDERARGFAHAAPRTEHHGIEATVLQ